VSIILVKCVCGLFKQKLKTIKNKIGEKFESETIIKKETFSFDIFTPGGGEKVKMKPINRI
jgi:hypothetical protein